MNFYIHSLNRFVLYLWVAGFLQLSAIYAIITHDPRNKWNWQKSEHSELQWSLWVWIVSRPQQGFRRQSPLGKVLAFKWHLDWLKIDLNVAEITTAPYYKHTQKKLISMEILRAKQVSEVSKGAEQPKKIFRL